MKAISTKYSGPTDTRGSRITASDEDGNRVSISYPHELSGEDVHRAAAEALCVKMGWKGKMVCGGTRRGYVFVFLDNGEAKDGPPPITPLEMDEADFPKAEAMAARLGFTQTAYTSTSALWGMFCLPDRAGQKLQGGCIIKTKEFGLMFVADDEDLGM